MKFGKKQQPHLGRFLSQHSSWSSLDGDKTNSSTHDGVVPTTPPSRHHRQRPPTRRTSWSSDDSLGDTNHSSSFMNSSQHSAASSSSLAENDAPFPREPEESTPRLVVEPSSRGHNHNQHHHRPLEPPVLVYHSCARSIVFRDSVRRATTTVTRSDATLRTGSSAPTEEPRVRTTAHQVVPPPPAEVPAPNKCATTTSTQPDSAADPEEEPGTTASSSAGGAGHSSPTSVRATHFQPRVVPLPPLELGPHQEFAPLLLVVREEDALLSSSLWTAAEHDVVTRLTLQSAVVKTIHSAEWTAFLNHFLHADHARRGQHSPRHVDVPSSNARRIFNSFVTSTSLLPSSGRKMRCYGSVTQYPVGVVFGLPTTAEDEDRIVRETETWAWPAGYAAKTEFNMDGHGKLINGRAEALTPLSVMRQYNDDYLNKDEYMVACKKTSGLSYIPYNEVYIRVGGHGRLVNGVDAATGEAAEPSYETGLGLPIALFVRTATYGNLISLMRARARLVHVLGEDHMKGIPLLLITPEQGVKVFTESLQGQFWKIAAQRLNPFQNSHISHKTTSTNADEAFMKQKMSELIHLDETIQERLTPEELARIAGGFGATDESLEEILTKVMLKDKKRNEATDGNNNNNKGQSSESHQLQDVVNEGLVYAVRSGDYHCSRQLLILYSIVATRMSDVDDDTDSIAGSSHDGNSITERRLVRSPDLAKCALMDLSKSVAAPPPPPLDTDRLRSATNSDGLLAVLGAAQVLKCMQDGGAKRRVEEVISALEEWLEYGQSVAFRISSWQHQRAAQRDLKIATESHSNFMAFAGTKAITNRKTFAQRLRDAAEVTDFSGARFLLALHEIIKTMHSPCLRLELLQYVLGLDNRYSVAHVGRSVELAATCLSMAASARTGSE